jgi:hypothetical protein
MLLLLAAVVGTFVFGYRRAESRPSTAFQYVARKLGRNDSIELDNGSTGRALSLSGQIARLRIGSLGAPAKERLAISLPLLGCSNVIAAGQVKCHAKHVDVDQGPLILRWSQPVLFCMAFDARSVSLSESPFFKGGLSITAGFDAADHPTQKAQCRPQSRAGDICFQTLPAPGRRLRIQDEFRAAVWRFRNLGVPSPSCLPGIKMLLGPDQVESNPSVTFDMPAQAFSLTAGASTGTFSSSEASAQTPEGHLNLGSGDTIHVRQARDLCAVFVFGGKSGVETPTASSTCRTHSGPVPNGIYISSPSVRSATRELGGLSGPGEQLVKSNYQRDPALWLALLGAYLTVVVTLLPGLGRGAYQVIWGGRSRHGSSSPRRKRLRRNRERGVS